MRPTTITASALLLLSFCARLEAWQSPARTPRLFCRDDDDEMNKCKSFPVDFCSCCPSSLTCSCSRPLPSLSAIVAAAVATAGFPLAAAAAVRAGSETVEVTEFVPTSFLEKFGLLAAPGVPNIIMVFGLLLSVYYFGVNSLEKKIGAVETSLKSEIGGLETKLGALETKVGALETSLKSEIGSATKKLDSKLDFLTNSIAARLDNQDEKLRLQDEKWRLFEEKQKHGHEKGQN